jgi:hypothetical protein
MSKQNKANRNNYSQAGRLTPDDMARERQKQRKVAADVRDERITNHQAEQVRQSRDERASSPPESEPRESE